jgi:hypothetical protein
VGCITAKVDSFRRLGSMIGNSPPTGPSAKGNIVLREVFAEGVATVAAPPECTHEPRAKFVQYEDVPEIVTVGQTVAVTVRMKNEGLIDWTPASFRLVSINPALNTTWGFNAASPHRLCPPAARWIFNW